MESSLEAAAQHLKTFNDVTGCLFADKHGLCLTAVGDAKPESSGIISAIAFHASRIEPKSEPPIILLESDSRDRPPLLKNQHFQEILLSSLYQKGG